MITGTKDKKKYPIVPQAKDLAWKPREDPEYLFVLSIRVSDVSIDSVYCAIVFLSGKKYYGSC